MYLKGNLPSVKLEIPDSNINNQNDLLVIELAVIMFSYKTVVVGEITSVLKCGSFGRLTDMVR